MRLLAPAKINLHLRVGPPGADGFHPLLSWFCTVGLFDTLTLTPSPPEEGAAMALQSDRADLPTDERNLVVRAARALADTCGPTRREGVSAFLHKRIPLGAGLGGGSSDAARAILGLNSLWNLRRSRDELARFAAKFGSDLPFFFYGPSCICTGRGEIVRPVAPPAPKWALLILPRIMMPTPAVYRRFDEMRLGQADNLAPEPDWRHWASLPADQLMPRLVNDLETPAFDLSPELKQLHRAGGDLLARTVRMSGSGSSLFTLLDDQSAAEAAARKLRSSLAVDAQAVEVAPQLADDLGAQ